MKGLTPQILAMYLGCEVQTPDGIGTLTGVGRGLTAEDHLSVFFGKIIDTPNAIDGQRKTKRNYGVYKLHPQYMVPLKEKAPYSEVLEIPGGVQPILRRLSSMSEEERNGLYQAFFTAPQGHTETFAKSTPVKRGRVCYTNDGLEIELDRLHPRAFAYLLSKSFDLFGLIDSGLAIEKEPVQGE